MTDFAVLGGDKRYTILCDKLISDGKTVSRRDLSARAIVLPVPRDTELVEKVCASVSRGQTVVGGMLSESEREAILQKGAQVKDYTQEESFLVMNAAITADGAMAVLKDQGLCPGMNVLVIGFGRIGKLIGQRLDKLGIPPHISSRSHSDRAWTQAYGYIPEDTLRLEKLERFHMIVNTVPSPILTERRIRSLRRDCCILDLASKPYGTDFAAAERAGIAALKAPGLPGKFAPETAADVLRETIYNILENPG